MTTGKIIGLLGLYSLISPLLSADAPKSSLEDQLSAAYPVVRLSRDNLTVTQQGTIFTVNKANIGTSNTTLVPSVATYRDGQIKTGKVGRFVKLAQKNPDLHIGDKVYLVKIDVKDQAINFSVQTCDACDFTPISTGLARAVVSFVFPKEVLEAADMNKIQRTVAEVFTPAAAAAPAQQSAGQPQIPQGQATPDQQPATNIEVGQTPEQVLSILGPPLRKATIGPKEIYFYKDMKITFQNGKVSDVE
jgi:hypothetical protein